jgi:hypothetical protein
MAVMARSVGIPTRIVSGYALGQQVKPNVYQVRASDAHTWVQVYFRGYGWINFEPSASFSQFNRATPKSPANLSGENVNPTPNARSTASRGRLSPDELLKPTATVVAGISTVVKKVGSGPSGIGLGLALVALALAAGWLLWRRLWGRPRSVDGLYARLCLIGATAGMPVEQSQTPLEYAARLGGLAPRARGPLERIATAYAIRRYAGAAAAADESQVAPLWGIVRPDLLRAVFGRPLRTLHGLRLPWRRRRAP